MVEPGRRCLGDRYELDRIIAAGGMGQVWRGLDTALHRSVAVKVLRSEYTGDPSFLARFRAEAQHAASLSHPNVAAVYDYGEETAQDGTGETLAYLIMELVEGEPLSALIAREGALGTGTTLRLLQQTAFALAEAHRGGLVHRDVKPGNILVRADGSVKITDFGIAWSARSVALTRTGQVIGTPQYLSPEQAEGRPASPASDVYALGLIGYECLAGHPAFSGDNAVAIALKQVRQDPEPLPAEVPADVRALIARALAKDAGARFPDGAAVVAAVDDVRAGRPLAVAPPTVEVPADVVPSARYSGSEGRGTGAVRRAPASRSRSRVAMVLLPLLGLLAGAGIAVALLLALTDDTAGTPAVAAEQRDSGSIVLDADQYVGLPVDEVVPRLTQLGLDVQPRGETRDDVAPDQVTAVEPIGTPLSAGDTVLVRYAIGSGAGAAAPPVPSAAGGPSPVQEEEPQVPVDEPAPEPTPVPSSTAPSTLEGTPTAERPTESPTTSASTGSETSTSATTSAATSSAAATTTPG